MRLSHLITGTIRRNGLRCTKHGKLYRARHFSRHCLPGKWSCILYCTSGKNSLVVLLSVFLIWYFVVCNKWEQIAILAWSLWCNVHFFVTMSLAQLKGCMQILLLQFSFSNPGIIVSFMNFLIHDKFSFCFFPYVIFLLFFLLFDEAG